VSDQGNKVIDDATATVSDAAAAVRDIRDASDDLSNEASVAQSNAEIGYQQLGGLVNKTEAAAKQSIDQAKQALASFISQQAYETAHSLVDLAVTTNATVIGGFSDIRAHANQTFNDINKAFSDLVEEGNFVLAAVNTAGVSFPQIVNSTIAKNASVTALIQAMIAKAQNGWDAIVADEFESFKTAINSADTQTQVDIDRKLGSLRTLASTLMSQVDNKMHALIARMVDIGAEANLSTINYQQSVANLNSSLTSIQEAARDAAVQLRNLSATQDANFAFLANQTAAVDALIAQEGADFKGKVFSQNASILAAIYNMTNNAKAQVSTDTASFVNFTQSFLNSII
jgi:hypothetical protein